MPHIEEIRAEEFRDTCALISRNLKERNFATRVLVSNTHRYIIEATHETKHLIITVRSVEKGPPHQIIHMFQPTISHIARSTFTDTLDAL